MNRPCREGWEWEGCLPTATSHSNVCTGGSEGETPPLPTDRRLWVVVKGSREGRRWCVSSSLFPESVKGTSKVRLIPLCRRRESRRVVATSPVSGSGLLPASDCVLCGRDGRPRGETNLPVCEPDVLRDMRFHGRESSTGRESFGVQPFSTMSGTGPKPSGVTLPLFVSRTDISEVETGSSVWRTGVLREPDHPI